MTTFISDPGRGTSSCVTPGLAGRRVVLTTLSGVFFTAALLTTPIPAAGVRPESTSTPLTRAVGNFGSEPAVSVTIPAPVPSVADQVKALHDESGLTWEQIGRLFGVSRRAVHLWAAGGRVNARHLELLATIQSAIRSLPASSPEERRLLLFSRQEGRQSPFDELLRGNHAGRKTVVSGSPFSSDELVAARYDEGVG